MPLFLGLDCGGSSCRAMVIDELGEPVFLSQGGSANLVTGTDATLRRSLNRALEGVPSVDAACACFAGLVTHSQRARAEGLVRDLVESPLLIVEPDYAAAFRAAPDGTDVCVIAGTGSVICSATSAGIAKSGGGGYILGDEGSGFQYGRIALKHFLREPDQASQALIQAVEQIFETREPGRIVERVYNANAPASIIAGLSAILLKDAQQGEAYALEALRTQSDALAAVTAAHLQKYHPGLQEPQVSLAGGLWKKAAFRDAFAEALGRQVPGVAVHKSEMPPVRGAALLAKEALYRK